MVNKTHDSSHEGKPWDFDTSNTFGQSERHLWFGVIEQALMDAISRSNYPPDVYAGFEAREWLRGDTQGFNNICRAANCDPGFVRRVAKQVMKQGYYNPTARGYNGKKCNANQFRKRLKELT